MLGEDEHLERLGVLSQVRVGVDEGLARAVLGEERQHRAGALRAAGDVVLVEGHVLAPVHDGMEVQVEVPGGVSDEVGRQHRLAERGEEGGLAGVVEPVGVGGERGGFGKGHQAGEQPGSDVGGQVVDVRDPSHSDQLQRQQ